MSRRIHRLLDRIASPTPPIYQLMTQIISGRWHRFNYSRYLVRDVNLREIWDVGRREGSRILFDAGRTVDVQDLPHITTTCDNYCHRKLSPTTSFISLEDQLTLANELEDSPSQSGCPSVSSTPSEISLLGEEYVLVGGCSVGSLFRVSMCVITYSVTCTLIHHL